MILKRNYVVLVKTSEDGPTWVQFSAYYERSKRAVRKQLPAGTWRIITARAWGREYTQ